MRPASIFDISNTSLIKFSKCSPLRLIVARDSRCLLVRVVSRSINWAKPRMAFKGVRSSWLIFAKKVLFARLAASAASLATLRACSA